MGPDQLAGVMETIKAKSMKSAWLPEEAAAQGQKLREEAHRDAECYATSSALLDDGIIDPRDTRDVLGMCLEVVRIPTAQDVQSQRFLARI